MGVEKEFQKVQFFSGIIYRDIKIFEIVKNKLIQLFSPIDIETDEIHFDFTTYYNQEMGSPLFRRFIGFEELILPQQLSDIKLLTNSIENDFAPEGNRSINLDPGYLSEANVIIATTKNYYHRIPLEKGIYAHMEYVIKGKKIYPLEWTYPDFKSEMYLEFFNQLKQIYKSKLRKLK